MEQHPPALHLSALDNFDRYNSVTVHWLLVHQLRLMPVRGQRRESDFKFHVFSLLI